MASNRQQLTSTLLKFYNQPVAQVSFELFLTIGAVIFFGVFAIRPTLLTMSDLIKEIEDKRALDTQLGQKIASLSTAQAEYLNNQARLVVLDEAIPTSPQLTQSLKIIEKTASDRNIVIVNMSVPEIPNEISGTLAFSQLERQTFPVTLTVTGEYPNIRNWLQDLTSTRRSFLIESVVFFTGEERGVKNLKATVSLGLPFFGPKTKPQGVKTGGAAAAESAGANE